MEYNSVVEKKLLWLLPHAHFAVLLLFVVSDTIVLGLGMRTHVSAGHISLAIPLPRRTSEYHRQRRTLLSGRRLTSSGKFLVLFQTTLHYDPLRLTCAKPAISVFSYTHHTVDKTKNIAIV
ncbi:hypothetical protein F4810DRAFT_102047 [Camillea tinctor]|nr:hypothetical protein F4810DRAFT_102047 [Camillea tinctor]